MKKAIKYGLFLCVLYTSSCSQKNLGTNAYLKYVQDIDNGLKKVIRTGEWEYTMQYKPYDYIICQECRNACTEDIRKERMKTLLGTAWFNISFKRANADVSPLKYQVSSPEEYNNRLDYFLNHTAKDIQLIYGGDTLRPSSYLFETNYNLTPQETIVVGFLLPGEKGQTDNDMQLTYTDRVFKNGIIKATYSSETLHKIPKLIYETK